MKIDNAKIKIIMAEQQLTHAALAQRMGCSRTWVSTQLGKNHTCRPATVGRIAKALGVSVADIVAGG